MSTATTHPPTLETPVAPTPESPAAPVPPPAPVAPRRRRFTVAEFQKMAELGILADEERVELIDGDIIVMSKIGSRHAASVSRLQSTFHDQVAGRARIRVQSPILLTDSTEPEPDVALARHRDDDYESGHPRPEDLFLVVEVMETSTGYDRSEKLPRYAQCNIAETWLVDPPNGLIEVYRRPLHGQYAEKGTFQRGQTVSPAAFPDVQVTVEGAVCRTEP